MNILLISQCSKNALTETRRIIDQFAERTGERTWSTPITKDGLDMLRKLLKKTARRNTAVACHWIRGKNRSELLWIVGDSSRFSENGSVPTNTTLRDILKSSDENNWNSLETISVLSCLAALFHDFGKSCADFQTKLISRKAERNIIRHEWISVVMFMAFIGGDDDRTWLTKLAEGDFDESWQQLINPNEKPFEKLPPLALAVCWLIVSHHRMPIPEEASPEVLKNIVAKWCRSHTEMEGKTDGYWKFDKCITSSAQWRKTAAKIAQRALKLPSHDIFDPFILFNARMVLMLSDHIYSSMPAAKTGSKDELYANTDSNNDLKQTLEEHLLGVEKQCRQILFTLPRADRMLPYISRNDILTRRNRIRKYSWQDKAFDTAYAVRHTAELGGFFGINMASTGCGKTIANARIMYALSDRKKGCRFTAALGLRSLTLQTGEEYRRLLGLSSDEMAVLAGGTATKELFALRNENAPSASEDELVPSCSFVHYDGGLNETPIGEWLRKTRGADKLVSAPVTVCTVDHIIPASEGTAGGRQLAPMLRLMTGDLILDEPDDYDISDLYAFSRLVWFAGLLGCRVLLSSATVTPSIAEGLFHAYRAGRQLYNKNRNVQHSHGIVCGWFDEYGSTAETDINQLNFAEKHREFAEKRAERLQKAEIRRNCRLLHIDSFSHKALAETISEKALELHKDNHITDANGNRISIGLVRIANIKHLVALVKEFSALGGDFKICCYHSRFPMLMRSEIEKHLDAVLKRNGSKEIYDHDCVRRAIAGRPDIKDHIFIVFASPVAEVGRDHDYDWAIAEPSSMKSLIQLAGRVRRHRDGAWDKLNMLILNKNIRAYEKNSIAYTMPGFEADNFELKEHDLSKILDAAQYETINSIPRIIEPSPMHTGENLCHLEHTRLKAVMALEDQRKVIGINQFWKTEYYLSGYLQKEFPFRKSSHEQEFVHLWNENDERAKFNTIDAKTGKFAESMNIEQDKFESGKSFFIPLNYKALLEEISGQFEMGMAESSLRFGRFTAGDTDMLFSPHLGIYSKLE